MSAARHLRAKEIFLELCDRDRADQSAMLEARCAGDAELRAAVEELLQGDSNPLGFGGGTWFRGKLESLAADVESGTREDSLEVIPHHRIVGRIGDGGFGTVYEAEQLAPVQRQVALKVIKLGMDTRQVLVRFEAERRVLGMLDHPCIARILDAGMSASGRPFFTMELVRGRAITDHCHHERLELRARLELLIAVCRAVQHAHQKGIVHRDLKPSNVLITVVDGVSIPKIIDFGIAKLLEDDGATPATMLTEQGQFLGTPEYMSPEQATTGARQIDSRSDIYSLGVLLYELLTGSTPFDLQDLRTRALEEMLRVIREVEPPRPSTRVGDPARAADGGGPSAAFARTLRGDLDWIVMKALDKDPARRYASASELAEDLERYLASAPVTARPPSSLYVLQKFSRRHKTVLAIGTLVFLALVGGLIGTSVGLRRADREKRRAELEADRARTEASIARALNDFLNDQLLAAVAPESAGVDVTMRQVLDIASQRIEGQFGDQPAVESALRMTLGKTYLSLGLAESAIPHLQRAAELRLATLGADAPETLAARDELAWAFYYREDLAAAIPLLTDVLARRTRELGAEDVKTLQTRYRLAAAYGDAGRLVDAEREFQTTLVGCRSALGDEDPQTIEALHGLGVLYHVLHREADAEKIMRESIAASDDLLGPEHPSTIQRRADLSAVLIAEGRSKEARDLLEPLIEVCARVRGEFHPTVAVLTQNLASAVAQLGDFERAESLLKRALAIKQKAFPHGLPDQGRVLRALAQLYREKGRFADAEQSYREAFEAFEKHLGAAHADTMATIADLVSLYQSRGDIAHAAEWQRRLSSR